MFFEYSFLKEWIKAIMIPSPIEIHVQITISPADAEEVDERILSNIWGNSS
jgi:hypothetical protein